MSFARFVPVAAAVAVAAIALPAGATPPGTNGKLLIERETRNGTNMYSVAPDGSASTRLTNLKGEEGDASWSPDGAKIAFVYVRDPENGPYEIWSINADGSGLERLTRHRTFSVNPAWSPDGTKIAYSTARGDTLRLFVMNADGSGKRRLAGNRRRGYGDPQWSPDGNRIAVAIFPTVENFDSSIATIDADDGGNLRQLTRRGGRDELNPNWSPDGSTIAFEVNRVFDRRQSDLWLMNADGSNERRLTKTRVYETNPAYSPDGTRIAFTSDRDNRGLSKTRRGRGFELYTMAVDGTDIQRVTTNRVADVFPDWQPVKP